MHKLQKLSELQIQISSWLILADLIAETNTDFKTNIQSYVRNHNKTTESIKQQLYNRAIPALLTELRMT